MKKIILIVILFLFCSRFSAQEQAKVIVSNTETSDIWIKWYSEYIYFDYPVFLYRQENGNNQWQFVDEFNLGNGLSQEMLNKDKVLEVLQNSVLGSRAKDLDGITLFILMLKSVEHPEVCDFLGTQYIDKNVADGKQYRYKICKDKSPDSNYLGISDYISVSKFSKINPPAGIKAWQEGYKANFSWQADEDKFMGVNVYRIHDGNNFELITPVPVIHSVDEEGNYPEVFFTDDSLNIGEEYRYIIKSIDYFGRESKPSSEIVVKINDVTPPLPPNRLVINVIGKQVQVYWEVENISDLAGYRVYRANPNSLDYISLNDNLIPRDNHTYFDSVTDIGVYTYKVATVDTSGNEALSNEYVADIKDVFPPSAPKNLVASSDTGVVHLEWDKCEDPDLMGYYIYRSINNNQETYMLMNADYITRNSHSDQLPKQIKSNFSYKVIAVDSSFNKSEFSNTVYTKLPDVTAPDKPVIKTVTRNNNALVIEWFPVHESDLSGYNIYRYTETQNQDEAEKINLDLISGLCIFTDRFADYNTTHKYYVVAVDSEGNFSAPSDACIAPQLDYPDANLEFDRFDLNHKSRKKLVKLEWKINYPEETKGFVVYRKTINQKHFTPLSGMITETNFQDNLREDNGTYQYRIGALGKDDKMYYSEPQELNFNNN